MQKRRFRGLAIFLSIALCFTMIPSIGFATEDSYEGHTYGADKDHKNIVVFGASTSSGYGLSDFVNHNAGFDVRNDKLEGYGEDTWTVEKATNEKKARMSETSYPWQLKKYIADTEFDGDLSKVTVNPMTINGMRTDEFRAILDKDYYKKAFEQEKYKTWHYDENGALAYCGFLGEHIDTLIGALRNGGAKLKDDTPISSKGHGTSIPGKNGGDSRWGFYGLGDDNVIAAYDAAQQYVKEQVEDADVIVFDACMNNFGTYLAERIGGFAGMPGYENQATYYKQSIDDIDGVSDKTWSEVKVIKQELLNNLEALGLGDYKDIADNKTAQEFLNAFLYCYADCVTNLSADIEIIKKLNPNAKVIVVGVYNTLEGISLSVGGQKVDFGKITGKAFDLVNAYIKALDKNSPNYYFADDSGDGTIETFMNQIINSESFEALMSDPNGKALMDNMYSADPEVTDTSFKQSFLKDYPFADDAETNYDAIIGGVKNTFGNQGIGLSFPGWKSYFNEQGELKEKNQKIAGTTYMTLGNLQAENPLAQFPMIDDPNKDETTYVTKALFENHEVPGAGGAKLYQAIANQLFNDSTLSAEETYEKMSAYFAQMSGGALALVPYDTLGDEDTITGKTYLIYTDDLDNPYNVTNDPDSKKIIYMTPELIPSKEKVEKMLYTAAKYNTLDLDRLMMNLSYMSAKFDHKENKVSLDGGETWQDIPDSVYDFKSVISKILVGDYLDTDSPEYQVTMELLQIVDRFMLYMGIGQHPSEKGCNAMFGAVKEAYDKANTGGYTAYEEVVAEALPYIAGLAMKIKEAYEKGDINSLVSMLGKMKDIKEALDMLEANGVELSKDQLQKILDAKEELMKRVEQILAAFDMTMDDVVEAFNDDATIDQVKGYVEKIQKLNAAIELLEDKGFKLELDEAQLDKIIELKNDLTGLVQKVMAKLELEPQDIKDLLTSDATVDKIVEAVNKIVALNKTLDMLEDKGFKLELSEEQLDTILAIKDDVSKLVKNVMDQLHLDADGVKDLLKNPETADKIVDAVNKVVALNEALNMLKENGIDLSKDQLQKLLEMKDDLTSLVNDVIDQFGLEADDVKDLLKNPETADKIVEAVGKLIAINEAVELLEDEGFDLSKEHLEKLFALRDEAHARFDEALELLGVSMDDIAKFIDDNTTPEKLAQYAKQIEAVKAVLDRLPKNKEELKAELEKKYEVVKRVLGEEGTRYLEGIFKLIKSLDIKNMSEEEIAKTVQGIIEELKVYAKAFFDLPVYEEIINYYEETLIPQLIGDNEQLKAQANELQKQVTKLKAKSIFAMPTASLAIANKKAKVNVSWEKDEDAAGYVFKVNGKETNFKEGKAAMTYSANAVIGKAYTFEVTPYIEDGAKKISGKTFKITFVPKVKVAKAKIKRVKKNAKSFKVKWKKVKNADGYQVYYKAAGKKAKKKLVKSGNKTALKIKKAKKVKKYRVNVRAYRIVNGKKYFGAWSNTKNVKYK